jgi:hypothetical protein
MKPILIWLFDQMEEVTVSRRDLPQKTNPKNAGTDHPISKPFYCLWRECAIRRRIPAECLALADCSMGRVAVHKSPLPLRQAHRSPKRLEVCCWRLHIPPLHDSSARRLRSRSSADRVPQALKVRPDRQLLAVYQHDCEFKIRERVILKKILDRKGALEFPDADLS